MSRPRLPDTLLLRNQSTRQQYYEQASKFLLQEGGCHWACRYPGIVRELLWLWLFPNQPSVQFLQNTLAGQVSKCLQCAVALHTARQDALNAYMAAQSSPGALGDHSTGESSLLSDSLRAWDIQRLTANLEKYGDLEAQKNRDDGEVSCLQSPMCSHAEILLQPRLLLGNDEGDKRLNAAFTASMSSLVKGDLCTPEMQQLPGIYLLCVHSNPPIRNWARRKMLSMGIREHPKFFLDRHEVLDILIHHCERLTMIRSGCDEGFGDESGIALPHALSDDEREVWTGVTFVIQQFAPWIVRDLLVPRYGGLLPLAFMCVMDNSNAVLPAAKYMHQLMQCLGGAFWQMLSCSFSAATFRRVLTSLATNPSAIVPVRHICLDLLEEIVVSLSHGEQDRAAHEGIHPKEEGPCRFADDIACFLSSRELRSGAAAHAAVSMKATRVLTRTLQRLLDRSGLSALPLISSPEWTPHVAGTACSPNLPVLSRLPAASLLAKIICMQTASIEVLLLRRSCAVALGAQHVVSNGAAEQHALSDSEIWLDSVWAWVVQCAGVENIPEQVHVALLQAARSLLIWPCDAAAAAADSHADAAIPGIMRRFTFLIVTYLESLSGTDTVLSALACNSEIESLLFELALVQHAGAKAAIQEMSSRIMGLGNEVTNRSGQVLHALACRSPAALATGMLAAFGHVRRMGLDGAAFGVLHYVFLYTGQLVPLLLERRLLRDSPDQLLKGAWELIQNFLSCRARLRSEDVMKRVGDAALDATACSLFTCFRALWPNFAFLVAEEAEAPSDDDAFDDRQQQSVASAHAQWIPTLAKWGGIASFTVRRHWCSCMVSILSTLRQHKQTLSTKERSILDKLIARRDLWTDDQYFTLCSELRPLGAEKVRGNLGLSALADLPSFGPSRGRGGSNKEVVDLPGGKKRHESSDGTQRSGNRSGRRDTQDKRKERLQRKSRLRGAIDSLSDSSSDDRKASAGHMEKTKKVARKQHTGVLDILSDMRASMRGGGTGAAQDVSGIGAGYKNDVPLDSMGKRTRRPTRTAQELKDDFLGAILWWDMREKSRPGLPCKTMPLAFESLDQYEDTLGPLLLEETWEQISSAFDQERAGVEDEEADYDSLRVLTYNEIDDFAYAAVRPSRATGEKYSEDSGSDAGFHEMDLVLLLSPEPHSVAHRDKKSEWNLRQRRREQAPMKVEHVLAMVEKSQHGDAERGVVRLKVLSRRTLRNRRFSQRLATLASIRDVANSDADANPEKPDKAEPASPTALDSELPDAHARLRLVCLNYSIATSEREFVALHGLRALDAATQRAILNPGLVPVASPSDPGQSRGNMAVVPRNTLNEDQMAAIIKCLEPGPVFSLIQGPPGTGKTSTLIGLITALLASPSGHVQAESRVLVCAPSNAAVDELAERVSQGLVLEGRSERYRPTVVRVGDKRQMRQNVWEAVALEEQVRRRLRELEDEANSAQAEIATLRAEVETLTERLEACETGAQEDVEQAVKDKDVSEGVRALQSARKQVLALCALKAAKAATTQSRRGVLKRQLRTQLLESAQVVFATLSGAGSEVMQSSARPFTAVIIDEAAQALEPSVLIPLQMHVTRCVLVGDPQQLPATVTSLKADRNLYARSLFERLQAAGLPASLLTVQYRMHPCIRAFPSKHFYEGKLTDCLGDGGRRAEWHADVRFAPLVFYDVRGGETGGHGSTSRSNRTEAAACIALLSALSRQMPGGESAMQRRVAVMSPYRRQCSEIRQGLAAVGFADVAVSSVDAFQGRETDVVVLSCVRSGSGGLGFVADVRRLNVALTRARQSLLIVGDADTLAQNQHWAALIEHARTEKCCVRLEEREIDNVFGSDGGWRVPSWPPSLLSLGRRHGPSEGHASLWAGRET